MKIFFGIVALVFLFATQGAFAEGWMCSSDENCPDKEICQDYRCIENNQNSMPDVTSLWSERPTTSAK